MKGFCFTVSYLDCIGNEAWTEVFTNLDEACKFAAEVAKEYDWFHLDADGNFYDFPSFPKQTIFEGNRQGTKWLLGGKESNEEAVRAFLAKYSDIGGRREARVKASPAYKELQGQPFAGMLLDLEGFPPPTPEEKAMAKEVNAMRRAIDEAEKEEIYARRKAAEEAANGLERK